MKSVLALPLLLLAGCATGSLDCTDLRQGACKVSFARFLTNTGATFTGPDGLGFTYNSDPNAQLAAEAMRSLNAIIPLIRPGPQLPPEPLTPQQQPTFSPVSLHRADGRIPWGLGGRDSLQPKAIIYPQACGPYPSSMPLY